MKWDNIHGARMACSTQDRNRGTARPACGGVQLLALGLILLVPLQNILGESFEIAGEIEVTRYLPLVDESRTVTFDFSVRSNGALWLIRTVPHRYFTDNSAEVAQYYEAGTDGTNTYHVVVLNDKYDVVAGRTGFLSELDKVEERLLAKGANADALQQLREMKRHVGRFEQGAATAKPKNQAIGMIVPGNIPVFQEADIIALLWLAYCNVGRFVEGRQLAPDLLSQRPSSFSASSNVFLVAESTFSDGHPRVPSMIRFFDLSTMVAAPRGSPWPEAHEGIEVQESIRAIYEASGFRDIQGIVVPDEFFFQRYSRGGDRLDLEASGVLRAATLAPVSESDSFLPKVPGVNRVDDYRLVDELEGRPLGYFADPGKWPNADEARVTRAYELARLRMERETAGRRQALNRRVFFMIVCFVLTAPLLVYVAKRCGADVVSSS